MREKFDDRLKEWSPLKKGNSKVKTEKDKGVDDYNKAKWANKCHLILIVIIYHIVGG